MALLSTLIALHVALPATAAPAIADLPFADFYARPIGPRGLQPTAALRKADGQRVRLTGYVVSRDEPGADYLLFAARPVALSDHADGEADDLPAATVAVMLPTADTPKPPSGRLLRLTGILHVGRAEHADGRVSWVQLRLDHSAATEVLR